MRSIAAGIVLFSVVSAARAGDRDLSAAAAWRLHDQGRVTVIDVRTPGEWRQTGIPRGAQAVTLNDPAGEDGFVRAVTEALGGDVSRPVALICARGNRSLRAMSILRQAGFSNVYNVANGMLGRRDAKGWIESGLPTDPCLKC